MGCAGARLHGKRFAQLPNCAARRQSVRFCMRRSAARQKHVTLLQQTALERCDLINFFCFRAILC